MLESCVILCHKCASPHSCVVPQSQPYQQFDIGSVSAGHRHTRRADVGVRRRPNVILLIGPTSGRRLRRLDVGPTSGQCHLPAVPQFKVSGSPNAQPMLGRCQAYMWPTLGRHRADVRPTFDHQTDPLPANIRNWVFHGIKCDGITTLHGIHVQTNTPMYKKWCSYNHNYCTPKQWKLINVTWFCKQWYMSHNYYGYSNKEEWLMEFYQYVKFCTNEA